MAFCSYASNLVPGLDENGGPNPDVYVHDQQTGETKRVSVDSNGAQSNDWSCKPSISADGRFVAFDSFASNLVADDTNGAMDLFVHDRAKSQTWRLSVADNGSQANDNSHYPAISGDGCTVSFASYATNLVAADTNDFQDIFVRIGMCGWKIFFPLTRNQ